MRSNQKLMSAAAPSQFPKFTNRLENNFLKCCAECETASYCRAAANPQESVFINILSHRMLTITQQKGTKWGVCQILHIPLAAQ